MKDELLQMRIEGDLKERIKKEANKQGLTLSAWIMMLIYRELEK